MVTFKIVTMENIIIPIGMKKALVFEPEAGNEDHKRFAGEIKKVARTSPGTIQEFFERLAKLQEQGNLTETDN
jgi:hypothetical protein